MADHSKPTLGNDIRMMPSGVGMVTKRRYHVYGEWRGMPATMPDTGEWK